MQSAAAASAPGCRPEEGHVPVAAAFVQADARRQEDAPASHPHSPQCPPKVFECANSPRTSQV